MVGVGCIAASCNKYSHTFSELTVGGSSQSSISVIIVYD